MQLGVQPPFVRRSGVCAGRLAPFFARMLEAVRFSESFQGPFFVSKLCADRTMHSLYKQKPTFILAESFSLTRERPRKTSVCNL